MSYDFPCHNLWLGQSQRSLASHYSVDVSAESAVPSWSAVLVCSRTKSRSVLARYPHFLAPILMNGGPPCPAHLHLARVATATPSIRLASRGERMGSSALVFSAAILCAVASDTLTPGSP